MLLLPFYDELTSTQKHTHKTRTSENPSFGLNEPSHVLRLSILINNGGSFLLMKHKRNVDFQHLRRSTIKVVFFLSVYVSVLHASLCCLQPSCVCKVLQDFWILAQLTNTISCLQPSTTSSVLSSALWSLNFSVHSFRFVRFRCFSSTYMRERENLFYPRKIQ